MLRSERAGQTLLLTIDRPGARNAVSAALAERLFAALAEASADGALSAVVMASSHPQVFVAGGDLKELAALPTDAAGAGRVLALGRLAAAVEGCAVPVVAAVAGAALGGGAELLVACDLVVMEPGASVRFVHASLGLTPAWGGTTRLVERIGALRAHELLLTARTVEATEAYAIGLANRLVARGEAVAQALALATDLGRLPRSSLVAMKRSLAASRAARRAGALAAEAEVFREGWGSEAQQHAFGRFRAGGGEQ